MIYTQVTHECSNCICMVTQDRQDCQGCHEVSVTNHKDGVQTLRIGFTVIFYIRPISCYLLTFKCILVELLLFLKFDSLSNEVSKSSLYYSPPKIWVELPLHPDSIYSLTSYLFSHIVLYLKKVNKQARCMQRNWVYCTNTES